MLTYLAHILVSPINQCLLMIFIGYCISRCTNKYPRAIPTSLALASFWFLLCTQYFFANLLMKPIEAQSPPIRLESDSWRNTTGIWVLACYHHEAEDLPIVTQFNACSLERLVHAALMYKTQNMPIYLTGADFNQRSETMHAEKAKELLVKLGVKEVDINVITKGKNTREEAKALASKISLTNAKDTVKAISVVSSASHGVRIQNLMRELKQPIVFVPVHTMVKGPIHYGFNWPNANAMRQTERAIYEHLALFRDKWFRTND